jgi:hypothetical protein
MKASEARKASTETRTKLLPNILKRELAQARKAIDSAISVGSFMATLDLSMSNEVVIELMKEGYNVNRYGSIGVPYKTIITW